VKYFLVPMAGLDFMPEPHNLVGQRLHSDIVESDDSTGTNKGRIHFEVGPNPRVSMISVDK
jgi:hypothetical protein